MLPNVLNQSSIQVTNLKEYDLKRYVRTSSSKLGNIVNIVFPKFFRILVHSSSGRNMYLEYETAQSNEHESIITE